MQSFHNYRMGEKGAVTEEQINAYVNSARVRILGGFTPDQEQDIRAALADHIQTMPPEWQAYFVAGRANIIYAQPDILHEIYKEYGGKLKGTAGFYRDMVNEKYDISGPTVYMPAEFKSDGAVKYDGRTLMHEVVHHLDDFLVKDVGTTKLEWSDNDYWKDAVRKAYEHNRPPNVKGYVNSRGGIDDPYAHSEVLATMFEQYLHFKEKSPEALETRMNRLWGRELTKKFGIGDPPDPNSFLEQVKKAGKSHLLTRDKAVDASIEQWKKDEIAAGRSPSDQEVQAQRDSALVNYSQWEAKSAPNQKSDLKKDGRGSDKEGSCLNHFNEKAQGIDSTAPECIVTPSGNKIDLNTFGRNQ